MTLMKIKKNNNNKIWAKTIKRDKCNFAVTTWRWYIPNESPPEGALALTKQTSQFPLTVCSSTAICPPGGAWSPHDKSSCSSTIWQQRWCQAFLSELASLPLLHISHYYICWHGWMGIWDMSYLDLCYTTPKYFIQWVCVTFVNCFLSYILLITLP